MRIKLWEWVVTILSFIMILYLYIIISYLGLEDFFQEGALKDYFNTNLWHLEIFISGISLGILFILINHLTEKQVFRRKSFGFNILLKSALYIIAVIIVFVLIYFIFLYAELATVEQMKIYKRIVTSKPLLSFLVYYGSIILLMNFIHYVNTKFGQGSLIDILTGKYYHPRNEELIFLFLDLKGSTALAEKLGHNQYSRFLKECIHELTPIIQKYHARVYQYVGDEVVLYWEIKDGLNQQNCLNAFFEFNSNLSQRKEYFMSKYGLAPEFKAGMDTGVITATEIGDIKREIAFHGDVLNTASRLEKKCNEFREKLIVSEHVSDQIHSNNRYHFKLLSDLPLRGKSENIKFYAVRNI